MASRSLPPPHGVSVFNASSFSPTQLHSDALYTKLQADHCQLPLDFVYPATTSPHHACVCCRWLFGASVWLCTESECAHFVCKVSFPVSSHSRQGFTETNQRRCMFRACVRGFAIQTGVCCKAVWLPDKSLQSSFKDLLPLLRYQNSSGVACNHSTDF